MVKVISAFIGNERKPFLIMDIDPRSADRRLLGARFAAVTGYLKFASKTGFFLKAKDGSKSPRRALWPMSVLCPATLRARTARNQSRCFFLKQLLTASPALTTAAEFSPCRPPWSGITGRIILNMASPGKSAMPSWSSYTHLPGQLFLSHPSSRGRPPARYSALPTATLPPPSGGILTAAMWAKPPLFTICALPPPPEITFLQ